MPFPVRYLLRFHAGRSSHTVSLVSACSLPYEGRRTLPSALASVTRSPHKTPGIRLSRFTVRFLIQKKKDLRRNDIAVSVWLVTVFLLTVGSTAGRVTACLLPWPPSRSTTNNIITSEVLCSDWCLNEMAGFFIIVAVGTSGSFAYSVILAASQLLAPACLVYTRGISLSIGYFKIFIFYPFFAFIVKKLLFLCLLNHELFVFVFRIQVTTEPKKTSDIKRLRVKQIYWSCWSRIG